MFEFEGLSIFTGSIENVVSKVDSWIRRKQAAYICVTGAHGIVEAHNDPQVHDAHKQATLIVPDGMPLVWLGKWFGHRETERIYGPDLMLALCKKAEAKKWRVYLYGTTEETIKKLWDERY